MSHNSTIRREPQLNFGAMILSFLGSLVSISGLFEGAKNVSKVLFVFICSVACAFLFWYIRALISSIIDCSYRNYAISLDSFFFGTVPSLWIQQNLRSELLDIFLRWVWLSYGFVILFGSSLAFIVRAEGKRHFLAVLLSLLAGLFIHYLIPTQPPWMALDGVVRINGDYLTRMDKNLVAAMPSMHQAIVCLAGCSLWRYGAWGKLLAIVYNLMMSVALVYLGEHYFVDSVAGIFLAILSWSISKKLISSNWVDNL